MPITYAVCRLKSHKQTQRPFANWIKLKANLAKGICHRSHSHDPMRCKKIDGWSSNKLDAYCIEWPSPSLGCLILSVCAMCMQRINTCFAVGHFSPSSFNRTQITSSLLFLLVSIHLIFLPPYARFRTALDKWKQIFCALIFTYTLHNLRVSPRNNVIYTCLQQCVCECVSVCIWRWITFKSRQLNGHHEEKVEKLVVSDTIAQVLRLIDHLPLMIRVIFHQRKNTLIFWPCVVLLLHRRRPMAGLFQERCE